MQPESRKPTRQDLREEAYLCDAYEQQIHDMLDRRRAPEDSEQLQAEADLSPEHQQLLTGQQLMIEGLELAELPELPNDFAQRCVAAVAEESIADAPVVREKMSDTSRRVDWRFLAFTAVSAAAILIAAIPLWNWLHQDSGQPAIAERPVEVSPPIDDVVTAGENSIPNGPAVDEIQDRVSPDPESPTPMIDPESVANTPVPEAAVPPYHDLYEAFRDLRQRLPATDGEEDLLALRPQWVEDMAGGFRPVADSVGGALNVLRRNLPPSTKVEPADKPQARSLGFGSAGHLS